MLKQSTPGAVHPVQGTHTGAVQWNSPMDKFVGDSCAGAGVEWEVSCSRGGRSWRQCVMS